MKSPLIFSLLFLIMIALFPVAQSMEKVENTLNLQTVIDLAKKGNQQEKILGMLLDANKTIEDLIFDYKKLNKSNKLIKENKKIIKDLYKIRPITTKISPKKNKQFYGNFKNAQDATNEQLLLYEKMIIGFKKLKNNPISNSSAITNSLDFLDALQTFHQFNKLICEEFSTNSMQSSTYPRALYPRVHPELKDLPFEDKANYFLNIVHLLYIQFEKQGELGKYALLISGLRGCLENRITKLSELIDYKLL